MNFLEEFWPVAFFFVIMGISYARNAAKIKREASQTPPEVLSEEFPQIDTQEYLEESPQMQQNFFESLGKQKSEQKRHNKKPAQPSRRSVENTPPPAPQEEERKERLISMKNKSEAKRAFIYSEIFNRKY
ncbi:MAG: hypothetical protein IJF00_06990 [Bacteroidaceae bacterium]|nr:hypothetical protein [Bacteroidaceae bacterium]MBQ3122395.1 hypothetical protein [Bacteroidaceae bacterium]